MFSLKLLPVRALALSPLLFIASCDSGSNSLGPTSSTSHEFQVLDDASAPGTQQPRYVIGGPAGTTWVWSDIQGRTTHAEYTSTSGAASASVEYDVDTGDPVLLQDNTTGEYLVIEERSADRVDFLQYDANDQYLSGYAVYLDSGVYYQADLIGRPSFSGQMVGQFASSQGGPSGSYVLIADLVGDLGTPVPLSNSLVSLMTTLGTNTYRGGSGLSLSTALKWGGIAVGSLAGLSLLPASFGAAGVAMMITGFAGRDIADWIRDHGHSDIPIVQELTDLAANAIADPSQPSLQDYWTRLLDNVADGTQFSNEALNEAKDDFTAVFDPAQFTGAPINTLPDLNHVPIDGPPSISTTVAGQAVWQDGSLYVLDGSMDMNGDFGANGSDNGGSQMDMTGTVQGTQVAGSYVRGADDGSVDGEAEDIGQCDTAQGSGGQGTFSFAHYVGQGQGSVDFFYDAYSIPDAFIVRTISGERFSTGGLVSGSQTVTIPLFDEPIVFISVSAPRSGTAWEYSVTCLE